MLPNTRGFWPPPWSQQCPGRVLTQVTAAGQHPTHTLPVSGWMTPTPQQQECWPCTPTQTPTIFIVAALCLSLLPCVAKSDSVLQYLTCCVPAPSGVSRPWQSYSVSPLSFRSGKRGASASLHCSSPSPWWPSVLLHLLSRLLEQALWHPGISVSPEGGSEGNALLLWREEVSHWRRGKKSSSPKSSSAHCSTNQCLPWQKRPGSN